MASLQRLLLTRVAKGEHHELTSSRSGTSATQPPARHPTKNSHGFVSRIPAWPTPAARIRMENSRCSAMHFAANCQTIGTVTMTSSPAETNPGYRKLVAVASALEHWLQTLFLKVEAGKPAALLSEDFRSTEDRPVKWRGSSPVVMECGVGSKSLPRFIAR